MKDIGFRKNSASRIVAISAALGALTVLLTVTRLGFIPWFSGAAITILHIPVILAVCLNPNGFDGLWAGLGVGAVFGVSSLVYAAVSPAGPIDPFFQNPLISVVPRLLFAAAVFLLYKGGSAVLNRICPCLALVSIAAAAFLGTLIHAIFVLGALVLASAIPMEVMWAVLVGNSFLEAAAALVLCTAVVGSFQGISKRKVSKLNSKSEG
ncbi:ECF transporter S component [Treponema sp. OMZ 840]|uniref:ECF transporter S component n=1 Tax=Treponema sp. OMZ 840 TaxID=244313 RepID=UPI003D925BA2